MAESRREAPPTRIGSPESEPSLGCVDAYSLGEDATRTTGSEHSGKNPKFLRTLDRELPQEVDLHLIVDNYRTHKHANVDAWLERHPRFQLHFTPTSSSWLNLVERWFRELTDKAIRRGVFHSVPDLVATIEEFLAAHNGDPKPFTWTASIDSILEKVGRCKAVLETVH